VEDAGLRLARLASHGADREVAALAARRRSLASGSRAQLDRQDDRLVGVRSTLARSAAAALAAAGAGLANRSSRLAAGATQALEVAELRAAQHRRLLGAYDVHRQLERGWSVTRGPDGSVLRSVAGLLPGAVLTTQLADGTLTSEVSAVGTGNDSHEPTQTGAP
jgi:exodeoxyribonuclease VII large subunit